MGKWKPKHKDLDDDFPQAENSRPGKSHPFVGTFIRKYTPAPDPDNCYKFYTSSDLRNAFGAFAVKTDPLPRIIADLEDEGFISDIDFQGRPGIAVNRKPSHLNAIDNE